MVAEEATPYLALSPEALSKKIKQLTKQMHQHADNLEFEAAAKLRDEIQHLQQGRLEVV